MTISALIVDDERLARNRLRRLLEQQEVEIVGEGQNGEHALALVRNHAADIIFLDINMPVMNGLEAAACIAKEIAQPPSVVFCTAYDEYALDAFATNASAYLLKPVSSEDLSRVIIQAGKISRLQAAQAAAETGIIPSALLKISNRGKVENIPLSEIAYFKSLDKHVFAFIRERGEVLVDYTLKELQAIFPHSLVRTHRSSLAVISNLRKLDRDGQGGAMVYVAFADAALPVSRRHFAEVRACF